MSLGPLKDIAISAAAAAARAVIKTLVDPRDQAAHFDATAERLKFDAEGQRKLDARKGV